MQVQPALVLVTVAVKPVGINDPQEKFMELIQAALAALLGRPGVSLPATFAVPQLAWLLGLLSAVFKLLQTFPLWLPEK